MKKFIKKIGKGIKKVGKAIGKPFKKLMKTKIGKIIGTIGMMMIGGWMMAGAKSFVGTMWAGEGMAAAFTEGISAMGTAAKASYTTITEGVKGMFGKTSATQEASSKALANSTATGTDFATDAIVSGGQAPNIIGDQIAGMSPPTGVQASATGTGTGTIDFAQSTDALASKGSGIPTENLTETAINEGADSTVTIDALGETTIKKVKPKSILDKTPEFVEGTATDDFANVEGYKTVRPGPNLQDRIVRKATDQETFADTFADFWHGDTKFSTIKDKTLGMKPLQSFEGLPGFIREGTVGEGMVLRTALQTPEEPYFPGSTDLTGAYAALDANAQRLYTGNTPSMAELGDGRTRMPSPSVIGTEDYFNNTRKAGFIYDTSLLAIKPSEIVT
jgi:hypothetical protein